MNRDAARSIALPGLDEESVHTELSELFRFEFGRAGSDAESVVDTGLRCFGVPEASEPWMGAGPASSGREGRVKLAGNADFLLGHMSLEAPGPERLADLTCTAYLEIVRSLRDAGFGHLLRAWNFMPYINVGQDDTEGYRQFCVGRAVAISTLGLLPPDLPAATGVGTPGSRNLVVAVLGSRQRARHLENPRQVPAYEYPRQYGPRSPSFARATLISGAADTTLFLAGTASVVGHVSLHHAQAAQQTAETFSNIREVLAVAGKEATAARMESSGGRVYVRNEADLAKIEEVVTGAGVLDQAPLYLEADICRAELLVEIELVTKIG
jgi:chorismate lyase/3-hydroxybenzoate synthase